MEENDFRVKSKSITIRSRKSIKPYPSSYTQINKNVIKLQNFNLVCTCLPKIAAMFVVVIDIVVAAEYSVSGLFTSAETGKSFKFSLFPNAKIFKYNIQNVFGSHMPRNIPQFLQSAS